MCCCSVERNKDNIYGSNSIAKTVEGQAIVRESIFFSGRMMCLYIRVIPKICDLICDLIAVKRMPLSLGSSLKDQAIFALQRGGAA